MTRITRETHFEVPTYRTNFNFCPLSEPRRAERQRHWPRMVRYENTIGTITKVTSVPCLNGQKLKFAWYPREHRREREYRVNSNLCTTKVVSYSTSGRIRSWSVKDYSHTVVARSSSSTMFTLLETINGVFFLHIPVVRKYRANFNFRPLSEPRPGTI